MFLHCTADDDPGVDFTTRLTDPEAAPFLLSALAHFAPSSSTPLPPSIPALLTTIQDLHAEFTHTAQNTRLAYALMRVLHDFMRAHGWRTTPNAAADGVEEGRLRFMARVLQGVGADGKKGVARDIVWIGRVVKYARIFQSISS